MDRPRSADAGRGLVASFIPRSGAQGLLRTRRVPAHRSDRINLKVRHRANSLKLKRLYERTDEGLERWRTEFDAPLPAGPEHFRDVLDLIGRAGSAERLGAAERAGEVVEILDAICDPSQLVTVHKSRRRFQRGTCGVDEVRFRARGGTYRSLGIESGSLDDLRSLVQDLDRRAGFALQLHRVPRSIADGRSPRRVDTCPAADVVSRRWCCRPGRARTTRRPDLDRWCHRGRSRPRRGRAASRCR